MFTPSAKSEIRQFHVMLIKITIIIIIIIIIIVIIMLNGYKTLLHGHRKEKETKKAVF